MTPVPDRYSIPEAARILAMSVPAGYRAVKEGRLRTFMFRGQTRVSRTELERTLGRPLVADDVVRSLAPAPRYGEVRGEQHR
jgi:excisionase family DNA binding protein